MRQSTIDAKNLLTQRTLEMGLTRSEQCEIEELSHAIAKSLDKEKEMLENASLEQLGHALADIHSLSERTHIPNETDKEVARRSNFSKEETENLLELHFRIFKNDPSTKNWACLYAMMTCHQGLSLVQHGSMSNLAKD